MNTTKEFDLIGVEEATQITGLCKAAVTQHANAGKLPPVARLGKRGLMVFDRAQVVEYARRRNEAKARRRARTKGAA